MEHDGNNADQTDFSTYSTDQLVEELARRGGAPAQPAVPAREFAVRFTSWPSVLGWLQALYLRQPLHGAGVVRFEQDGLVLRGWQRSWLGVPLQTEIRLDPGAVRNTVSDGALVRFESQLDGERRRRWQCYAEDAASATALAEQLPATRTEGFDEEWAQLRAFEQGCRLAAPRPWAAPTLVALNILVFAVLAFSGAGLWAADVEVLTRWGSNLGLLTMGGQQWRLLTSMFLHAGILHLALNMWVLWGAGRLAERIFGSATFVVLYLTAGLIASLSSVAWNPFNNSVGASGAIFGVLGACLALLFRRDARVPRKLVRAHGLSTLAFTLFSLVNGFIGNQIDNAAHVGGLIGGAVLGWILARPLDPQSRVRLRPLQTAMAACVAALALGAGFWQLHALSSTQSSSERYWTRHQWLLEAQGKAMRAMGEVQARAAAGTLSDEELERKLEQEILAAWTDADTRLLDEAPEVDPELQKFAALVADFVRLRREAALAAVDAVKDEDRARGIDAAEYMAKADQLSARINRLEMRDRAARPHSLSESRAAKAVRDFFARPFWRCATPPGIAPDVAESASDGRAGRVAGGCLAQRAFVSGDYATLDRMLHPPPQKQLADLDDGSSLLSGAFGGLDDLFERQQTLDATLSRLADWRQLRPDSDGPDLVEAILLRSWAWSVRGHGFAKSVSPQQWALFAQRIEMAAAALEDAERNGRRSPVWFELALTLGLERTTSTEDLRAIFEDGRVRFPDYYQLHVGMLRVLQPRWRGSYGEVDNFIAEMVRAESAAGGPQMYARLYASFASLEGDDTDVFEEAYAKWPNMKQGLQDLIERHPRSESLRNSYAAFACRAEDAETYRIARAAIKSVLASIWTEKFSVKNCDANLL